MIAADVVRAGECAALGTVGVEAEDFQRRCQPSFRRLPVCPISGRRAIEIVKELGGTAELLHKDSGWLAKPHFR